MSVRVGSTSDPFTSGPGDPDVAWGLGPGPAGAGAGAVEVVRPEPTTPPPMTAATASAAAADRSTVRRARRRSPRRRTSSAGRCGTCRSVWRRVSNGSDMACSSSRGGRRGRRGPSASPGWRPGCRPGARRARSGRGRGAPSRCPPGHRSRPRRRGSTGRTGGAAPRRDAAPQGGAGVPRRQATWSSLGAAACRVCCSARSGARRPRTVRRQRLTASRYAVVRTQASGAVGPVQPPPVRPGAHERLLHALGCLVAVADHGVQLVHQARERCGVEVVELLRVHACPPISVVPPCVALTRSTPWRGTRLHRSPKSFGAAPRPPSITTGASVSQRFRRCGGRGPRRGATSPRRRPR